MAENSDYSDEEDRDDCDNTFEKISPAIKQDQDLDMVSKVAEDLVIHPQSELFLSRRLSGLPLMYPTNETSKIVLDEKASKDFNALLDRFPKPPEDADISSTVTIIPGSGSLSTLSNSKAHNTWGSFKGFAEKFYNFSKN